jgi:hypothetical protein
MMDNIMKIVGSQKRASRVGVTELMVTSVVVFLLIAVQGVFIDKHPVTLNAAAELAPFGIVTP